MDAKHGKAAFICFYLDGNVRAFNLLTLLIGRNYYKPWQEIRWQRVEAKNGSCVTIASLAVAKVLMIERMRKLVEYQRLRHFCDHLRSFIRAEDLATASLLE